MSVRLSNNNHLPVPFARRALLLVCAAVALALWTGYVAAQAAMAVLVAGVVLFIARREADRVANHALDPNVSRSEASLAVMRGFAMSVWLPLGLGWLVSSLSGSYQAPEVSFWMGVGYFAAFGTLPFLWTLRRRFVGGQ